MAETETFRFRPRFRALPWAAGVIGLALLAGAFVFDFQGGSRTFALVAGPVGVLLSLLYLASPAWRLRVAVSDQALRVVRGDTVKVEIPWTEVEQLIVSPDTATCYVNGGTPARSLLVPGPGAPGPYRIEHQERLVALITARVPEERQREVPSLETCVPKQ